MRKIDKDRILNLMVSFNDVLTAENKNLLKKYFLDDIVKQKKGTQKELDEIYNVIFKLQEIEELRKIHKCKFTEFEISVLVKHGLVDKLIFCIKSNCIADNRSGYPQLRESLSNIIEEENIAPILPVKKPKTDKPNFDVKKVTKIVNFINKNGGLSKEELMILSKMLGYKANSIQVIKTEDEKTL